MLSKQELDVERMINEIIENFNFERCHYVMKALDWHWFPEEVPTIARLKESAKDRLKSVASEILKRNNGLTVRDYYFSSSGGLKATGWKNKYGHVVYLQLEFVLSEWQADGD
jgi:hypothetical protein